jgi:signal transduction histidine kinase/CheY-like chemotaxis protein
MSHWSLAIRFGKGLILVSVVAGAYFLFGLLGLLFRIPADPVGIIMPTSGLALAAALLLGRRVLPAIVIGNFCVNAWFFNFNQEYLIFYVASSLGVALSAWVSCRLVRRLVGFPEPLVNGRKIVLFLCFAGPVGCLLSAVVGITAMYVCGIIPLNQMPLVGLKWWIAEILGVLIFTPLLLMLFAEPHYIWYRRRTTVGLPIVLTFSLVTLLFYYLLEVGRQQCTEQLKEKTIALSQALKNRIQLDLYSMHVLKDFVLDSQQIQPQEILLLANQSLFSFKEIKFISWIGFTKNSAEESQFISAFSESQHNKPEILKAIPPELKRKILGVAPFSETEFLISENDGFKLIVPVVQEVKQKRTSLGVIIAGISLDRAIHQALDNLNSTNYSMTISLPQAATSDAKIIYTNRVDTDHNDYQTISVPVIDQTWLFSVYQDGDKERTAIYWPIKRVTFSGFWFTGILGIVLLQLTGRNFRTEEIIDERTKVLTETKIAAEQANQAKNQFLAKISHELRTPLNGISGFAQLLEKKPTLNAEDKKQIAIIKQCSDDLLRLISDMLDISAIETQQIKLEISEFNFTILLNDSIRICKFKADEKGLKLFAKNTSLPRKFFGDEKRIRQILVNLIDNAVKYTSQGSVTITASYQNNVMNISVTDTGVGIAEEDLKSIFLPFVQINADTFTREGIGLGLSITKELVYLMDGDITVRSHPGSGSIFRVSLPLPVSVNNRTQVIAEMPDVEIKGNIAHALVVDDSEINLLFLVSMLEQLGCQVDSAKDGQEALALFEQNPYDFALIDINMPVMNGLELVKRLRHRQAKLKLVAVSAYADDSKINEALEAGFDTYITKPIQEYQLVELIQASGKSSKTNQDAIHK